MQYGTFIVIPHVSLCYRDWLKTQYRESLNLDTDTATYSWLNSIPEINHSRELGRTCINSLLHKQLGSIANPLNYSKGCGGVMHVAPVGLFFNNEYSLEKKQIFSVRKLQRSLTVTSWDIFLQQCLCILSVYLLTPTEYPCLKR